MPKHYEIKEKPKKALLVSIYDKGESSIVNSCVQELQGLVSTLGVEIAGHEKVCVREKNPKFGIGSGKAAELVQQAAELQAELIVLDWDPSPSQLRNWENLSLTENSAGIPVMDRQELIIRIFAQRAATKEAELQVKLAELTYYLPRLTHKYVNLSQQRGGHYGTRGAGETKLETDRRAIERRISRLKDEIEKVRIQRQTQKRRRERQGFPVCAIVGYTNTGKSSLLNALTGADVLVENKLFVTLDAVTRRYQPAPGVTVLLTDTVGFIRKLPHSLITAFRSTLEEAAMADILIHILDASEPDIDNNYQTTFSVLREMGARDIPMITLLNKIDKLNDENPRERLQELINRFPGSIAVSVKKRIGLDELKNKIAESAEQTPKT